MAARWPNGDLPMIAGFIVVRRRSTGAPTVTGRPPDDRRRGIGGTSAENLVISWGNRTVAEQSPDGGRQVPAGWLYDLVQGQENWPVSCRSWKIGISEKSADHRSINKVCDVGLRHSVTKLFPWSNCCRTEMEKKDADRFIHMLYAILQVYGISLYGLVETDINIGCISSYYNSSSICVCVPYLLWGPLTDLRQTWWVYVGGPWNCPWGVLFRKGQRVNGSTGHFRFPLYYICTSLMPHSCNRRLLHCCCCI